MGGSTVSSTNSARKTGCQHVEVGSPGAGVISGCENTGMPLIYPSTHKNQPQMNQRPQYETRNVEIPRRKTWAIPTSYRCKRDSLIRAPALQGLRLIITKWDTIKLKIFCNIKGTIS